MSFLVGALGLILLMIIGVWLMVFGGGGALLGPRRGRTRVHGFVLGALLGPIGCIWLLATDGASSAPGAVELSSDEEDDDFPF